MFVLVHPWFGLLLCLGAGVLRPALACLELAPDTRAARWACFCLCGLLCALPLLCLPAWVPLRFELLLGTLLYLGTDDARGAQGLFEGHVRPRLQALLSVSAEIKEEASSPRPSATIDEKVSDEGSEAVVVEE